MLDKNMLFGFAAGCVLGAVGYKFYNDHKDDIDEKIKGLKNFKVLNGNEGNEEKAQELKQFSEIGVQRFFIQHREQEEDEEAELKKLLEEDEINMIGQENEHRIS